ncbi:MAG TPA: chemotaxis protein CheW [Longimicrobiales bacterium]|nr:chemotaxis protein CheW [Longimicrobiales bacterium]
MSEQRGLAHFVVCRIDDDRYALRSDQVERVLERVAIQPLPWLPRTIAGVLRLGDAWLPVVDPAAALKPGLAATARPTVLVLRRAGQHYGITVDEAIGRRELHAHRLQDGTGARTVTRFEDIEGTGVLSDDEGLITLLDPDWLFKAEAGEAVEQRRRDWSGAGTTSIVSFRVGGASLGLHVGQVTEVLPWREPERMESTHDFVLGSTMLREERVPLLDLGALFGLRPVAGTSGAGTAAAGTPAEHDEKTRILIVEIEAERYGLVVDQVSEVERVSADAITSAPRFLRRMANEAIDAVARVEDGLLLLIRLDRVLELAGLGVGEPPKAKPPKPKPPAKRKRKPRPKA